MMTSCVTPNTLHLQKSTIDLLFKVKKNLKTLVKFLDPHPTSMIMS